MKSGSEVSRKFNHMPAKPGREMVYLFADEMFEPNVAFNVPGMDSLAEVLVQFDLGGRASSKSLRLNKFIAKHSMLDTLVLLRSNAPNEKPYRLADWSQGIPGDVSFSPAVCSGSDDLRYEKAWNVDNYVGNFGCREWTAQLYDREQPYIDVTSYAKNRVFIGEFVGWSRFTDPRKPVIGKHGTTWLCLHECPAGEKPGIIPNIKAWVAKHGFPMPQRPRRQPLYPNANYLDDIREE